MAKAEPARPALIAVPWQKSCSWTQRQCLWFDLKHRTQASDVSALASAGTSQKNCHQKLVGSICCSPRIAKTAYMSHSSIEITLYLKLCACWDLATVIRKKLYCEIHTDQPQRSKTSI